MLSHNLLCPPLGGSPKALEVSSFVGLLLCLVYVTDISLLPDKHGLESMGDRLLARFEAAALDGFVDRSAE